MHSSHYLDIAEHQIKEGAPELSTGDTAVCEASWDAALRSAGLAVMRGGCCDDGAGARMRFARCDRPGTMRRRSAGWVFAFSIMWRWRRGTRRRRTGSNGC